MTGYSDSDDPNSPSSMRQRGMNRVKSDVTGNDLLCYYGDCRKYADRDYYVDVFDSVNNRMMRYVFCSWEHQATMAFKESE